MKGTLLEVTDHVKKTFPKQLCDSMELCGYTAAELAEKVGVTSGMISTWRLGRNLPSVQTSLVLAEALGVSVELLLTGKERW